MQLKPEPGLPLVGLRQAGEQTAKLIDQAHGHVIPRPDGRRAKCAGPNGCWTCHMESLVYESRMNLFVDQGLVLKPGDKLLLIAPRSLPQDVIDEHITKLKSRFPEVEVTIVTGFTGVQVANTQ